MPSRLMPSRLTPSRLMPNGLGSVGIHLLRIIGLLLSAFVNPVFAQDININLAKLPVGAESKDKGVYVELAKAIQKHYQGGEVTYEIYPFGRSINNVTTGYADMHMPFPRSQKAGKLLAKMGLEYTDVVLNKVSFALYYRTDNYRVQQWVDNQFPVSGLNDLQVLTQQQMLIFFDDYPLAGGTCLPCMVKMVNARRVDGLIFAAKDVDSIVDKEGFNELKSVFFMNLSGSPVFRTDEKGKVVNRKVSDILRKLQANGRLAEIFRPYTDYYIGRFGDKAL